MTGADAVLDTVMGSIHAARLFAAGAFVSLLLTLGVALSRLRQQVLHEEADAALEADFRRLEAEISEQSSPASETDRGGR
jgi:hypothetical protein